MGDCCKVCKMDDNREIKLFNDVIFAGAVEFCEFISVPLGYGAIILVTFLTQHDCEL